MQGGIVGVFKRSTAIIANCFVAPDFLRTPMSDNSHATVHEEAHTGPIKTPKQLLLAAFFRS